MTTVELAKLLGKHRRTIWRWCTILGYEREGRDFLLNKTQVKEITRMVRAGKGRPPREGEN